MDTTEYLDYYYGNNGLNLRRMVTRILRPWGGDALSDKEQFLDIANEVFVSVIENYDGSVKFSTFLETCLRNKFKTELKARNAIKRGLGYVTVSLDAPVNDEDDLELKDIIPDDIRIEDAVLAKYEMIDGNVAKYMNTLSDIERKFVELRLGGSTVDETMREMGLTVRECERISNSVSSYEKLKIIKGNDDSKGRITREEKSMPVIKKSNEKTRKSAFSANAMEKKFFNGEIIDDYPGQRCSGQWDQKMKSDLIRTILRGEEFPPIVLCERVTSDGNYSDNILIDGKQRSSTIVEYRHDGFPISKRIEMPFITYQVAIKDEDGKLTRDSDGHLLYEEVEYDIRGKKFSKLPQELQDAITEYQVSFVQYLNCTSAEIDYHMRRYNNVRQMNNAQKAITYAGESLARLCKNITNHEFFTSKAWKNAKSKGNTEKVVFDSIMLIHSPSEWCKDPIETARYLAANGKVTWFADFEEKLGRLCDVISEENMKYFSVKDAHLFFALFNTFTGYGLDDSKFNEFLDMFDVLRNHEVDGQSFDSLNEKRGTRDKKIITDKMKVMKAYLADYFGLSREEKIEKFYTDNNREFCESFRESDLITGLKINTNDADRIAGTALLLIRGEETIKDIDIQKLFYEEKISDDEAGDVLLYANILDDWLLNVDGCCPYSDESRIPDLLYVIDYANKKEIDDNVMRDWFVETANSNSVKSRSELINSLTRYIGYISEKTA